MIVFSISIVVCLITFVYVVGSQRGKGLLKLRKNVWGCETYFYHGLQSQHSSITVCSNCKLKAIRRTLRNNIKTWEDEHSTTLLRKLLWRFITLITFIVSSCHFICSLNLFVFSSRIRICLCLHIYFYEMSSQYFLAAHKVTLKSCIL